jgi:hypothetical protein
LDANLFIEGRLTPLGGTMASSADLAPIDPREVTAWSEGYALEQLDRWEGRIPARSLAEIPSVPGGEALVVGDSHGDWPTVEMLIGRFLSGAGARARWIALGDYVDRTPNGLPQGSLRNALYLLSLRAARPDAVVLLRGNHETQRQIPAGMHFVRDEAEALWGSPVVAERIQDLFDRLPLAAVTESGAYLAHAGFPLGPGDDWRAELASASERVLFEVVWNDVEMSPACGHRGVDQEPIGQENLERFLSRAGCSVFLRGHDPDMAGQLLFGGRVLTVHGARVFPRAGLTVASLPLGEPARELSESSVHRLSFPPLPARRA